MQLVTEFKIYQFVQRKMEVDLNIVLQRLLAVVVAARPLLRPRLEVEPPPQRPRRPLRLERRRRRLVLEQRPRHFI